MDDYLKIIFIPIISATIGWITNKIAVWLLFNPKSPKRFLGITIQGIFPKRQNIIAQRISEMVMENLLSPEVIKNKVFSPANINELQRVIAQKIDFYLNHELKENYPILSVFIRTKHKEQIKQEVKEKLNEGIEDLRNNFSAYLNQRINLKQVIYDKISNLDSGEVNNLMNSILSKELKFIELIGAILGFIIGLIQVLLFSYL